MRNIFAILTVVLCFLAAAAIASAATQTVTGSGTIGSGSSGTTLNINTSSNVQILYDGAPQAFGATSDHFAGDKVYATGNTVSGLVWQYKQAAGKTGMHWTTDPTSTFSPGSGGGWTTQ